MNEQQCYTRRNNTLYYCVDIRVSNAYCTQPPEAGGGVKRGFVINASYVYVYYIFYARS